MQIIRTISAPTLHIYAILPFIDQYHFAPKQTLARIDYLRLSERPLDKNGTYNVKILAEKWTTFS